jgi:deoxyribose-phosphate aldolase
MSIYGILDPDLLKGIVDSAAVGMDVTDEALRRYIEQFKQYPESSVVVVNFHQGKLAVDLCKGSHVQPCIAIAYPPLCSIPTELKVSQARYALEEMGAPHILFTIEHSKFKDGKFAAVREDIAAVVKAVDHRADVIVMPDFAHWNAEECIQLAEIIRDAGGDMIKSTGGLGRAELPEKIAAVVQAVKGSIRVMGTSAIRNLDDVLDMLDASPDKIAISRVGFFTTLDEIHTLAEVRISKADLAHRFEGMIWHPLITEAEAGKYLQKCEQAGLYGVSVDPRWVPLAAEVLKAGKTKVIARVDYPLGSTPTAMKVEELSWVVKNGPGNIDIQVPLNTAAFKSGQYGYVREELDALLEAADSRPVSVILQTPLLNEAEAAAAALLCAACGVSYVEPIHGFGKFTPDGTVIQPAALNPKDIKQLKNIVGGKLGVKVTGGVPRLLQALVMINNGAERITLPNAIELLNEYETLVKRVERYSRVKPHP